MLTPSVQKEAKLLQNEIRSVLPQFKVELRAHLN